MLSLIGSIPIHLGELSFFEQHGLRNGVELHDPTSSCLDGFLKVFIQESHPNKKMVVNKKKLNFKH